ncbi:MAG TPA: bifunctional MaoC family dehydratase N-terminal/OB-fold nucleic acid binding domain-containing protein, partial [Acidimicrobiales bacterium]|nr:bifunctional MaoC family dehydratase N-terminal/OB-fold nucleic acid binding domain-containing protein [Acidimicrobiales bacterium]
ATNCEQEYHRYLRPGDRLVMESVIESVSERKQTALGPGYFVTTRSDYRDAVGELVGTMRFRVLKFRPAASGDGPARPPARRPRPALTKDNAFFFEGARAGRLLIQRCSGCGRLRHPPRPACAHCGSLDWDTVESSGRGHVYSFVVNHHPQVPGFEYPLVVALVELDEGTRLVSNLLGVGRDQVRIGMPVVAEMVEVDEELTLPMFRPAGGGGG